MAAGTEWRYAQLVAQSDFQAMVAEPDIAAREAALLSLLDKAVTAINETRNELFETRSSAKMQEIDAGTWSSTCHE